MKNFLKKVSPYLCLIFISLFFFLLYAFTFNGHPLTRNVWDKGPMNLEGGWYAGMAKGLHPLLSSSSPKVLRHPLCSILYPAIHRPLTAFLSLKDPPLVCSFLGSISIAIFGFWLYQRCGKSPIIYPFVLLLGFSFSVWYVSSIWESRALILFSSVILLISLDGLILRPSFSRVFLVVAATVVMLLSCLANLYNLVLVPVALLLLAGRRVTGRGIDQPRFLPGCSSPDIKKVSFRQAILWSLGYVGITLAVIILFYQFFALFNPRLNLFRIQDRRAVIAHCERQMKEGADWNRFGDFDQICTGAFESVLYSVGGLKLPGNVTIYKPLAKGGAGQNEWKARYAFLQYGSHWPGRVFIGGYIIVLIITAGTAVRQKIWSREPLFLVILFWIVLTTAIMIYINPCTTAVFLVELLPGIWALCALTFRGLNRKVMVVFLSAFVVVVAWNNYMVIDFFRDHYARLALAPVSPAINLDRNSVRNLLNLKGVKIEGSSHNLSRPIDNVADNDSKTFWQVSISKDGPASWILIDLGSDRSMVVRFLAARPREDCPAEFFRDARLQASSDKQVWEVIGDIQQDASPTDSNWRLWPLGNVGRFRYYRLLIFNGHGKPTYQKVVSISELGLYQ